MYEFQNIIKDDKNAVILSTDVSLSGCLFTQFKHFNLRVIAFTEIEWIIPTILVCKILVVYINWFMM